jgi:hypothetical protein
MYLIRLRIDFSGRLRLYHMSIHEFKYVMLSPFSSSLQGPPPRPWS